MLEGDSRHKDALCSVEKYSATIQNLRSHAPCFQKKKRETQTQTQTIRSLFVFAETAKIIYFVHFLGFELQRIPIFNSCAQCCLTDQYFLRVLNKF